MLRNGRYKKILLQLARDGEVTVKQLARRCEISSTTIRRELAELEKAGLLRRTRGGAIQIEPMLYEPFRYLDSFVREEQYHAAEKRRIALAAAETIKDGDIVALGAGPITTQIGRSISYRKGITVVTNAVNIAMELSHRAGLKIIVTGGQMSGDRFALSGPTGIATVGDMFYDKVFIGVDGIHLEHGLTTNNPEHGAVHRAMLRQSNYKIVVADHTTMGKIGTTLIASIANVDLIVTNKRAARDLSAVSTKVLVAG